MTEFVSSIKKIPYSSEKVFNKLSDFNNLEKIKERLPEDKIKDLAFDKDTCSFKAEHVGMITVRIIEREPNKTIKIESEKSPVPFTCWIQLKEVDPEDTRIRLTLKSDIPFIFKAMVSKPLEDGIERLAEALSLLEY
jgi:uncharacterized protein YqkB